MKQVNCKGNQFWIFIGRTDTEAETPIFWWPDAKNWLIWKDPDTGKDWRQEESRTTEDEMVGWHHLQWTWVWASSGCSQTGKPGVSQYMGCKELDTTELNWKPTGNDGRREEVCCQGQHLEEPRCREHSRLLSLPFQNPPSLAFSTLWVFSYLISVSPPALPPHTHTQQCIGWAGLLIRQLTLLLRNEETGWRLRNSQSPQSHYLQRTDYPQWGLPCPICCAPREEAAWLILQGLWS